MMKLTTYLIPTIFGSRVTMEYKIVICKRDMRTRFCKRNEKYIIDTDVLNNLVNKYDLIILRRERNVNTFLTYFFIFF